MSNEVNNPKKIFTINPFTNRYLINSVNKINNLALQEVIAFDILNKKEIKAYIYPDTVILFKNSIDKEVDVIVVQDGNNIVFVDILNPNSYKVSKN